MCARQNSLEKPVKSEQQVLFEKLRHMVACKHQVPEHMTVWELTTIINFLNKEIIVCEMVL